MKLSERSVRGDAPLMHRMSVDPSSLVNGIGTSAPSPFTSPVRHRGRYDCGWVTFSVMVNHRAVVRAKRRRDGRQSVSAVQDAVSPEWVWMRGGFGIGWEAGVQR